MSDQEKEPLHIEGYVFAGGKIIEGPYAALAAHTHSRVKRSDGIVPPEEQFEYALQRGWGLMPTEHNSLEGFERMLKQKKNNGYKDYEGELVPAYEHTLIDKNGKHS